MKYWLLRLKILANKFKNFLKRVFKKRKEDSYEIELYVGRKSFRIPADLVEEYRQR